MAVGELCRVLRPRGTLLLTTRTTDPARCCASRSGGAASGGHFEPRSEHMRFFPPRTLRDDLGFDVCELRTTAGGPPGLRSTILARAIRG